MTGVAALGRRADELARETEALRRLPDELAAGLRDLGLGRAMAPSEVGGGERPVAEVVEVVEQLGYHDGATAWCGMIAATTSLIGGYLAPAWAEQVYGSPDAHTGGFAAPVGRGRPVEEGLAVDGRWQWGSGTHHCTWIGGGVRVVDGAGEPAVLADGAVAPFVLFPAGEVELHDTWHVAGLKGTGSVDYTVTDAVVPEGRWVQLGAAPAVDRPLYRFSFMGALAAGVAAVGLGLARRAEDELVDLAGGKRPQGSSRTVAERPVVQAAIAEARAARRAGRLLLDAGIADAAAFAEHGSSASAGDDAAVRVELRRAASHAMRVAAEAVDTCYSAGGGAAVHDRSPLQRVFRDVHVATQHAMVAPRTMEVVGRADLGLPTDTSQL